MENKLPVTQCQYCGSRDIGEGWQHGEALVTFRKRGLSGNRLRYLLCRQCGAILYQCVAEPQKYTCPYKYIPREAFLPMINQDSVDDSTEKWLDNIESRLYYERWYCGHWHISKRVDKLHFLFHDFEIAEE